MHSEKTSECFNDKVLFLDYHLGDGYTMVQSTQAPEVPPTPHQDKETFKAACKHRFCYKTLTHLDSLGD